MATELGFLDCAAVELGIEPNFKVYKKWVDNQHHLPLEYLGKNLDKREDPRRLGEHLSTGIAFCHPTPQEFKSRHIARYAWGGDYHHLFRSKLRQLSSQFQAQFGPLLEEKICVDTIPLLERSLCERAGLGWVGKNGCLISRKNGSFFLLSVWLISAKLPKKLQAPPASFDCGNCTRCLKACPTDAFLSPGVLDAGRCLATQTIEWRKPIDPVFFPHIKEQAFGCDICQEVCPWNRRHSPNIEEEHLPPIQELLRLDEAGFRSYFRKTALERPGWAGLRRNFLILAANMEPFPRQIIRAHLEHPQQLVRQTAEDLLIYKDSQSETPPRQ